MQSPPTVVYDTCAENGAASTLKEALSRNNVPAAEADCTGADPTLHSPVDDRLSSTDKEVVRIIGQHLCSLGLQKSSETLMLESGCRLEHSVATRFRDCIMNGHWKDMELIFQEMKPFIKRSKHLDKMKFFVMEQQFMELVEDGRVIEALICLRSQITPLRIFVNRIHQLSSFLMISCPQELCKAANWEGKGQKSREKLLDKLLGYLPISVMMRPNRLSALLTQARKYQQSQCLFHNSSELPSSYSLLTDHFCLRSNFPTTTKQILHEHSDEILYCQFSHKGDMLATGSKDATVSIWNIDPVTRRVSLARSLCGHTFAVSYLAWNPTDTHILACGAEEVSDVWLWNAQTGELCEKISNSEEDSLTCCCWMPDGKRFIAGGNKGQFYQCDLDGNIRESWDGVRVQAVGCLPDNKTVLAADTQWRIRSYNFDSMTDSNLLKEDHPIMSFTLSEDGRFVLLNVSTQGVHLWDVQDQILIRKYQGVVNRTFMVYSTFGGSSNEYIASGSEDHKIYLWHRSRERPIETLTGHTSTVNCVSWNKAHPSMLASVSDDGTVRIWGSQHFSDTDSDDDLSRSGDF